MMAGHLFEVTMIWLMLLFGFLLVFVCASCLTLMGKSVASFFISPEQDRGEESKEIPNAWNSKLREIMSFNFLRDSERGIDLDIRFAGSHDMTNGEFIDKVHAVLGSHRNDVSAVEVELNRDCGRGKAVRINPEAITLSWLAGSRWKYFRSEFCKANGGSIASTCALDSIKIRFHLPASYFNRALRSESEWQRYDLAMKEIGRAWEESALSREVPFELFVGSDYIVLNRYASRFGGGEV